MRVGCPDTTSHIGWTHHAWWAVCTQCTSCRAPSHGQPTATWPCWGSSGVRAWIPRGIHIHPSPLQHPGWNFTPARCTYAWSVLLGTALTVSEVTARATHQARQARTTRVPLPYPTRMRSAFERRNVGNLLPIMSYEGREEMCLWCTQDHTTRI